MNTSKASLRNSAPALLTFFVLGLLFYSIGYWLIFRLERATPLMMSIGLAAIATGLIHRRPISSLGLSWASNRDQWASFLIPLGIALVSYLVIWGGGFGEFNSDFTSSLRNAYNLADWNDASIILFHVVLSGTFSLCLSIPSILGEEVAWRGFLVSELSKFMSFTGVALVSGILWSIFHWPLMIKGFYGSEHTPFLFQLGLFTLFIVSNSITMTYFRYKTDSVWSAVLFHASSNVFIQKVFTPLTVVDKNSSWYVDEFGAVVPFVAFLVAMYFWRKAKKEFR
jgi:membrane protease YdiL (CAAX protease family)